MRMRKKNFGDESWRSNPNAVYVGRPTKWGNPYKLSMYSLEDALRLYEEWLVKQLDKDPDFIELLRGKDLVCFCKLTAPCHADIISKYLELTKPIHAHLAYVGSELGCSKCNPICADKHPMGYLQWCGHPQCPMNPDKFKQRGNQ